MKHINWKLSKYKVINFIHAACFIIKMMRLNLLIITKKKFQKKLIDKLLFNLHKYKN